MQLILANILFTYARKKVTGALIISEQRNTEAKEMQLPCSSINPCGTGVILMGDIKRKSVQYVIVEQDFTNPSAIQLL